MLVGVSGYAGAGKDAVGQILVNRFGYTRIGFADPLKRLALSADPLISTDVSYVNMVSQARLSALVADEGWTQAKAVPEVRQLLQRLGVGVREVFGSSAWVDLAFGSLSSKGAYVFTDVRFPEEATRILGEGGVVWRVTRPGVTQANSHVSESALEALEPGETIVNDGSLQDLERKVVDLYDSLTTASS